MKIGILDLLALPVRQPAHGVYNFLLTKQYASITPQVVSVWCRRRGHQTSYATYYGLGDPLRQLPEDLDLVFVSCYTQASALAYAVARLLRQQGTRTVIGGPHAKAYPRDCGRFFDVVVEECDEDLIADILKGGHEPGSVVSSERPFSALPPLEERMPDVRRASLLLGRWNYGPSAVPILTSTGCPYSCDFCIDWKNAYRLLPLDQLETDLRYLVRELPGALIAFHDPNFAVKFDQVLDVLEALPEKQRPPYIMESSLSILRGPRLERLARTNCIAVAPGVESWIDYSNKSGAGQRTGTDKVDQIVRQFEELHDHVSYLQANFLFGLDSDRGDEPVQSSRDFMTRTPFVWPTINIPVPFGGTLLHDDLMAAGRILRSLPFSFYYAPYLAITLQHYDPVGYYERLIALLEHATSRSMLESRLASTSSRRIRLVHRTRTISQRAELRRYREILNLLRTNASFRAFHEGRTNVLPEFYHRRYERMLGRYAPLLSRQDRLPDPVHTPLRTPSLGPAASTP